MRASANGLLLLGLAVILLFSKEVQSSRSGQVTDEQLAHEEASAANTQEAMMALSPLASRTEDALITAGGQLHTQMTKLTDAKAREVRLAKERRVEEEGVRESLKAREAAAIEVSDEQNTLKRASHLVDTARKEEEEEVKFRSESEEAQGKGVAEEGPAGVLLRDSKKLNRQSNLVLAKSQSTQAKALAALDLKMAESLANKARSGMAEARERFSHAISDRKKAVAAANLAARDAVRAASASLIENRGDPKLLAVVHGDVAGPQALQDVVAADAKHVDAAETHFGQTKGDLAKSRSAAHRLGAKLLAIQEEVDMLHHELATAQAAVLAAAKAHVAATAKLKSATAENLADQTRVAQMRAAQTQELRAELHEASHASLHSSSRYEAASAQMEAIREQRTRLEVEVARLKEEVRREKTARDDALDKLARTKADAEHEADGMGLLESRGARGRDAEGEEGGDMGVERSLAAVKAKQSAALDKQAEAVRSAKEEADSVHAAQEEVAKQLARVNELEASLKS